MAYWIIAGSSLETGKGKITESITARISRNQKLCEEVFVFDVPETLKFGSFDSLIKVADELGKVDSQVESVSRRVERQSLDLDASIELSSSVEDYVRNFKWDDVKFPRNRTVQDNIQAIMNSVQKIDEEVKNKTQQYTDAKQHAAMFARKEQASHIQRDLVDLLTPDRVNEAEDFVYSEHLTTVVLVVPRGADKDFLAQYQTFDPYVVPESAHRIAGDDKDGNSLWRVVMFKTAVDAFKTHCRQHRYTVRDFQFSAGKYREVVEAREASEAELRKQEAVLKRVCQAAFSDALVAWTHLKAIRTFVEAVLRYGVPPTFAAYLIKPGKYINKQTKLRSELLDILCAASSGGRGGYADVKESVNDEEGSEFLPYVYLPFAPLSAKSV